MTERFPGRNDPEHSPVLTPEESEQLLGSVLKELDITPVTDIRKRHYYFQLLRKQILKGTAVVCGVLLLGVLAPGTVAPAPISSVEAAPSGDASSAQITFQVSSLIPVQSITATLDDSSVAVEENGFQSYFVNVNENGYLLLEVYSATGMRSSHGMNIDCIDEQAPHVTRHFDVGDKIYIYLSDGDGTGVDYSAVRAGAPGASRYSAPLYYNERRGYVVYPYPESELYITIPDKQGNILTILLSPGSKHD